MLTQCALTLLATLPLQTPRVDTYDQTGPLTLLITYECEARQRPAFRAWMESNGVARFEAWKEEGVLAEYRLLFNWYVDEGTFDAMAFLRFDEFADVGKWNVIERTSPGGLSPTALELAEPVTTSSADIVWQNRGDVANANHRDSVYLMIPYEYLGLVSQYKDYVDGYVIPQLDGWVREGALEAFEVLLNRFPTGDRWKAMLVLEYKDLASFGLRKQTKNKVRVGLREVPEWVAWSDIKRTIRQEKEPVITDRLMPAE
jgi:hypothetical protein